MLASELKRSLVRFRREEGGIHMFSTVVVPLDGSELAERALPYAVRFAAERGGRLVLVRAALGPPPSGLDWERQQLAAMAEANAYLCLLYTSDAADE